MLITSQAIADELYIYPAKGQSAEQLDKDKYECYSCAKKDTGFDPMALPATETAAPKDEQQSGGGAAGGLIGGVRQSRKNSANEEKRADWENKETDNYANNRSNYNRAYSAYLEGRGYTVK